MTIPMTVTVTLIIGLSVQSDVFGFAVHVMICEPGVAKTTELPLTAAPLFVKLIVDGG